MGKRYYCEYCDKTMVSTPAIVKTHNKGLVHQKLVQQHYQQFKDPETILLEESGKRPCIRYASGTCIYDGVCKFSHYTVDQLNYMRGIVESRKTNQNLPQRSFTDLYNTLQKEITVKTTTKSENSTVIYDKNGVTHTLPWSYNAELDTIEDLPPSVKRFKPEDFENIHFEQWG